MTEKTPVLVNSTDATGLAMYRKFKSFKPNRESQYIHVYYDQYYLVNDMKVQLIEDRCYIIKNIPELKDSEDNIIRAEFNGFDYWHSFAITQELEGITLGQIIESEIDGTLANIPATVDNNFVITQAS